MIVNFQGNPQTSVISCYSPTNISDEQETEIFYTKLTCLTIQISKHNVLIIGGDLNAHLGKDSGYKYMPIIKLQIEMVKCSKTIFKKII